MVYGALAVYAVAWGGGGDILQVILFPLSIFLHQSSVVDVSYVVSLPTESEAIHIRSVETNKLGSKK
jgi:hypothetical protein